jgi:hypothetical protein
MNKLIPFLLLFSTAVSAQNYSDSVYQIENDFKSFKYEEVIRKSADLLSIDTLPSVLKPQLYMMKGISHFVLLEDTLAKDSFLEILKINPQFYPDSIVTSPKIITFFNDVKDKYQWYYMPKPQADADTIEQVNLVELYHLYKHKFRTSVVRSLLFPGLGHLYLENNTGWILAIPGGISFLSSLYYIIDTGNKRMSYLNAQDPDLISEKYKSYNSSYKMRNISIIVYSAIWLFSQFDILTSDYIELYSPPLYTQSPLISTSGLSFRLKF